MESIAEKLGFDPLNPPIRIPKNSDEELYIDDSTPSPYSVLTDEESAFLFKAVCRMVDEKSLRQGTALIDILGSTYCVGKRKRETDTRNTADISETAMIKFKR